ncbi:unnamed protein product [Arabis nemorensis]|uniref:Uncharacterized protein n=1 Tax=Arabis nemorensis TaxID=586526 RepID=A0A565B466_9BRAS|nr:unnamed protein product [Arabis nemorensis]
METKTESKEQQQQWKNPSSLSSSSRSSSITSDESDGHFDIRHFPLPKPPLSASEAQKQREAHQAYSSSVSSYTSSSWSSVHQNHIADLPGYDPNRIPSSVFSNKAGNSAEWSIASNESLFSIHDVNFTISTTTVRLGEIPRFEETVREITEIKPVPLPLIDTKPKESEKEKKPDQEEKSHSEIDDKIIEELMTELESDDEHEKEKDMIEARVLVEVKTEKQEEKEIVEYVKENKQEDSHGILSHSPSISFRSDTSNNSISSFAFPVLKEDGSAKSPVMEISGKVSQKRRPEYLLPQSPKQPPRPQTQFYQESGPQPELQPQRKASKQFESRTKSPKHPRNGLLSCFQCPSKCGLFK